MARADLLALTFDDLCALSNRGLAKRAQREVESGEANPELTEDADGTVKAAWPDGTRCTLAPDRPLSERCCTCLTPTVCRHLMAVVLLYQKTHAAAPEVQEETGAAGAALDAVWDPGAIRDEDLARQWKPAVLSQLRREFERGVVADLQRGRKPVAVLHSVAHIVRFLVPNDLRYTHCDCIDPAPCRHVPLAVWAFRLLPADQSAGLVATEKDEPAPADLLDEGERFWHDLIEHGLSGLPGSFLGRLGRLEERSRDAGLPWLADIAADLLHLHEGYAESDARFAGEEIADLAGEWCVRADALRARTGAAPLQFVGGSRVDRMGELGASRLVGMGCGLSVRRRAVQASVFLQDLNSGAVAVLRREFPQAADADPAKLPPFAKLGTTAAMKGATLAAIGAGQVVAQSAKRSANRQFLPTRSPATVQPQSFQWEQLREPVLAESFSALHAHLRALPPVCLRPRRLDENFHVCPVDRVESAGFSNADQAVYATLTDAQGGRALLRHPFYSRGSVGAEALLRALTSGCVKFVSGVVRPGAGGLMIAPVGVVCEENGRRTLIQPWVSTDAPVPATAQNANLMPNVAVASPWAALLNELRLALGELFLVGLSRADEALRQRWLRLREQTAACGFLRFLDLVSRVQSLLAERPHQFGASADVLCRAVLRLCVAMMIAAEGDALSA